MAVTGDGEPGHFPTAAKNTQILFRKPGYRSPGDLFPCVSGAGALSVENGGPTASANRLRSPTWAATADGGNPAWVGNASQFWKRSK